MNSNYYEKEERPLSRSEKIREAKSAFLQNSGKNTGRGFVRDTYIRNNVYDKNTPVRSSYSRNGYGREDSSIRMGVTDGRGEQLLLEKRKHHFGMLRMVIAGVLFFVLVLSFHFKFSYQGYDQAYVEQVLSEDGHWESLVKQVTQVMKQIVPKDGAGSENR